MSQQSVFGWVLCLCAGMTGGFVVGYRVSSIEKHGKAMTAVVASLPVASSQPGKEEVVVAAANPHRFELPGGNAKWKFVKIGVRDKVYFSGDATEDDAALLGETLKKNEYFSETGASALLSKGSDGTKVSFIVNGTAWNDGSVVGDLRRIIKLAASNIGGLPIQLCFLNGRLEQKRTIAVSVPTVDELVAEARKVPSISRNGCAITYDQTPDCWRALVGEPDSVNPGPDRNASIWTYICSDGLVVFQEQDVDPVFNTWPLPDGRPAGVVVSILSVVATRSGKDGEPTQRDVIPWIKSDR